MKTVLIRVSFVLLMFVLVVGAFKILEVRSCAQVQEGDRTRRGRKRPTGKVVQLNHQDREREYRIFVPEAYDKESPIPMVVCIHGGGGNGDQGSAMGLTPVAEENNFIAVYPNAIDGHWNDGRKTNMHVEHDKVIDDADFIRTIVQQVREQYNVDPNQIFATGVSNGGFMSQRLAMEQSETFSAVGIVIATMGEAIKDDFEPELPVSVLYMNGTDDPLVPYAGGPLTLDLFPRIRRLRGEPAPSRGVCVPTDEAVSIWLERNEISADPKKTKLEDVDGDDGSTVEYSLWTEGQQGTAVAIYKVVGGGHTIPGNPNRIPERLVGTNNMDINAFEKIWEFFQEHRRQPKKAEK